MDFTRKTHQTMNGFKMINKAMIIIPTFPTSLPKETTNSTTEFVTNEVFSSTEEIVSEKELKSEALNIEKEIQDMIDKANVILTLGVVPVVIDEKTKVEENLGKGIEKVSDKVDELGQEINNVRDKVAKTFDDTVSNVQTFGERMFTTSKGILERIEIFFVNLFETVKFYGKIIFGSILAILILTIICYCVRTIYAFVVTLLPSKPAFLSSRRSA